MGLPAARPQQDGRKAPPQPCPFPAILPRAGSAEIEWVSPLALYPGLDHALDPSHPNAVPPAANAPTIVTANCKPLGWHQLHQAPPAPYHISRRRAEPMFPAQR